MTVRTRFAPSPTGFLHIGGVRTALFNWLFARRHGGQFLLRIDDTDQGRNLDEALQPILDGFRWLGLDWDEGPDVGGPHAPYYQSQRSDRHREIVAELLRRGAAYRDYATTEETQAEREAAEREKRDFISSRRFMATTDVERARFESEGRTAVVRLKMPRSGTLTIPDLIRGDVEFRWEREQDHVIQRADGSCLYHLATVVDDHDFEITHVIRAEEHLSNTPRQIFIFEQLGWELPQFAHIPFVAEPGSKTKLSKRKLEKYLKHPDFKILYELGRAVVDRFEQSPPLDLFNPVIVDFYRQIGFLPDALLNYLVLLGWSLDSETEDFTREEMIETFSLERVNKSASSFDPKKLLAFQDRYMQQQPIKQKVAAMVPYLQRAGWVSSPPPCDTGPHLQKIVLAAGDRIRFHGGILDYPEFFRPDEELVYDETAFEKRLVQTPGAAEWLAEFLEATRTRGALSASDWEQLTKDFVEARGLQLKDLVHAVRLALTGKTVGFGLFETMEILGTESCQRRIRRALDRAHTRN